MKSNLPKNQMVYWHHFNETEEMAREVEAAFPNVVFGITPAIMKEQLDDQLEKFIRSTPDRKPPAVHRWQPPVGRWRFVRWFSGGPLVATAQGFLIL